MEPNVALYIQRYKEFKKQFGDQVALLLQSGQFFELYDWEENGVGHTNVREWAPLIGLSISETSKRGAVRLFGGFPYASLQKFERALTRQGYVVPVIVQVKDGADKVVDRVLDHVTSPGTVDDDNQQDTFCLSFLFDNDKENKTLHVAAAAFHPATGDIFSSESFAQYSTAGKEVPSVTVDEINMFIANHPPAEVVVYIEDPHQIWTELDVRKVLSIQSSRVLFTVRHLHQRSPKEEERILAKAFNMQETIITSALDIQCRPAVRQLLAAFVCFLQEHHTLLGTKLRAHRVWCTEGAVRMGNTALSQLGMVHPETGGYLRFLLKTRTALGRRMLRSRLLQPIADVDELKTRIDRIEGLRPIMLSPAGATIDIELKKIYDINRLHRRMQIGSLQLRDLPQLLSSYTAILNLVSLLREAAVHPFFLQRAALFEKWLQDFLNQHWDLSRVQQLLEADVEVVGEGPFHMWRRGMNTDLDESEDNWQKLAERCDVINDGITKQANDPKRLTLYPKDSSPFMLQGTEKRVDKIVKAVANAKKIEMNTKFFIVTKDLQELNADANTLRKTWRDLQQKQWTTTVDTVLQFPHLLEIQHFVAQIDTETCLARISNEYNYVAPEYTESDESGVEAIGLRHGIIERLRPDVPYISHNIRLGAFHEDVAETDSHITSTQSGLLVYGVNAAGKSSLMKALGLACLLAQAGAPVPATRFRIVPYRCIFTRILGNDNLWAGLSSFVVEMSEFRHILLYANARSLVLGDELCSGTESSSATALVAAGIQYLVSKKANFLFATHLHELTRLPPANLPAVKTVHLKVRYDAETDLLIYDRDLQTGAGSPLYGLEVCRALRLPTDFLEMAYEHRRTLANEVDGKQSRYNAAVILRSCSVCGISRKDSGLETHHIQFQSDANTEGFVAPGVHKNRESNLAVLCQKCHDDLHADRIVIKGWQDTSSGRLLNIESPSKIIQMPEELQSEQQPEQQKTAEAKVSKRRLKNQSGTQVPGVFLKTH